MDQGVNPRTGEPVGEPVPDTTADELDRIACSAAGIADLATRAERLRAVASALEANRAALVEVADAETALGAARLNGELTRASVQFEMFAEVVADGSFLEIVIDRPDPQARPAPRPDLRRMMVPIGPVAVYAASNFPFAFSVAGGDTASALAAGCPVVVKAHPGHPQTSLLSGRVIAGALAEPAAFAVVHGFETGRDLVRHPAIRAAAFTGSVAGGQALLALAQSRPEPIPFYGELGSLNPAVVTPGALASRAQEIVAGFVGSYLLGSGQFCTKPGLLFLPAGHGLDGALAAAAAGAAVGPVLTERICTGYEQGVRALEAQPQVRVLLRPDNRRGAGFTVSPALFAVSAAAFLERRGVLLEECFGPTALIVEYSSVDELVDALAVAPGSLTMTLHADPEGEAELASRLLQRAAAGAGRVVFGGWPTGVAVTAAQHHGGPWPATTSPLHTSVGTAAIRRFLRPVAWQGVPDALLPEALRDANPLGLPRRLG